MVVDCVFAGDNKNGKRPEVSDDDDDDKDDAIDDPMHLQSEDQEQKDAASATVSPSNENYSVLMDMSAEQQYRTQASRAEQHVERVINDNHVHSC